jgi:polyisoprenoid-binding protein YceI
MTRLALLALIAALAPPTLAGARPYVVDPAASKLAFTGAFDGRPFAGVFQTWSAQINFNPAHLETSKATVTVQTGSAFTGTREYDEAIQQPAWLDTRQFPVARFTTDGFRKTGANTFVAHGQVTIRNATYPVTLPFVVQQEGGRTRVRGDLTLDRTRFGIGSAEFPGEAPLAKAVKVRVDLVAIAR